MTLELPPWSARQPQEGRLFNPAFLASLLAAAASEHERRIAEGLEWPLAFIVPALVLFEDTRRELPAKTNARLLNWVSSKPNVRLQLPRRARALAPLVRESTRFGLRSGALWFEDGRLGSALDIAVLRSNSAGEATVCIERAGFLGRWFASVVDVASVYALFGIAP